MYICVDIYIYIYLYVYIYRERERPSEGVCGVARHCHASRWVALGRGDAQEPPPCRTAIGPYAYAFCEVIRGGGFLQARYPCSGGSR